MINKKPIVWTIAGSDSGGGAGIQADLKTFHALGVHGCSVITTVTAQNTVAVTDVHALATSVIDAQIQALADDLPAAAVKLGLQGDITALLSFLDQYSGYKVFDPVIGASSGAQLNRRLSDLKALLPYADIVTPNLMEAQALTGISISSYSDMQAAARCLQQCGAKAVLLKGGHYQGGAFKNDYYCDAEQSFWLAASTIDNANTHGSGCTLAAAITAALALGYPLADAVVIAKMFVHQGIRLAKPLGQGQGSVLQGSFPQQQQDLPFLSATPVLAPPAAFAELREAPGLYPVVDSSAWVLRLAKLGINTIQLRIKSGNLAAEVAESVAIAKRYALQLFINDHWQLAIKYGSYGVHLGQEDLQQADLAAIRAAGLRLGISTHCFYEVARAHALSPSYIACGPIYKTDSKDMAFAPQGLARLAYWRRLLTYPLVAIGGINSQRLVAVKETGVAGIAMISAITQAPVLELAVAELQGLMTGEGDRVSV